MKTRPGDTIYFLGIGGIGMSALARFYNDSGCQIFGYDKTRTALTRKLEEEGMQIHYNEDVGLIPEKVDMVIVTPAVPRTHSEWVYFRKTDVPVFKRSEILGMLSRSYRTLAIGGTHGKTTTSTMLSWLLKDGGVDCTSFLGGISSNFDANYLHGESDWMVVEADEFDRSFLHLQPEITAVLSLDPDHLDIYQRPEELRETYLEFLARTEPSGTLIIPEDVLADLRPENVDLLRSKDRQVLTFGIGKGDVCADNIEVKGGRFCFEYSFRHEKEKLELPLPGRHNVLNALVAIKIANQVGVPLDRIKKSLALFKGIKRRFELIFQSEECVYIDDYAHHPTELAAAIQAARELFPGRQITGIFQPHLFSRTRDFLDGFARELEKLDRLILLDIYPARELPIPGVSSDLLFEKVRMDEKVLIRKEHVLDWIKDHKLDVLMTLGAGDIDTLVPQFKEYLENGK